MMETIKFTVYKDTNLEYLWLKMYASLKYTDKNKDREFYARVRKFVRNRDADEKQRADIIDEYDKKIGYKSEEVYNRPIDKIHAFIVSMLEGKRN